MFIGKKAQTCLNVNYQNVHMFLEQPQGSADRLTLITFTLPSNRSQGTTRHRRRQNYPEQ